jgi:uncharacterized protein
VNLIRLLIFALAAWLIYRLFIAPRLKSFKKGKPKIESEAMVKCVECELHVPRTGAIRDGELWFCCRQHQEQHISQKKE